ncbi:MAG: YjbQ family protein [Planctomycetales bacterium]|nr:secondary thiamine-phosphate synthase enzyme YjbQ [bacterium]UNM06882.1 MAG: YjbQ family protein [Planctomycetales bacterium]
MEIITLDTGRREEFIDITSELRELISSRGWDRSARHAVLHLWCFHTTAGLTVNENADPDVQRDMLLAMSAIVPEDLDYRHAEGNSTAHVKSSLFGCSLSLPLVQGELKLGRWQGVYFCEFDGPRRGRQVGVQLISSST